jgi:hypothetical protein
MGRLQEYSANTPEASREEMAEAIGKVLEITSEYEDEDEDDSDSQ